MASKQYEYEERGWGTTSRSISNLPYLGTMLFSTFEHELPLGVSRYRCYMQHMVLICIRFV